MAAIRMMQGDSYPVFVALNMKDTGEAITPNKVSDVEIMVGEVLRKTYAAGETLYDKKAKEWYFTPTQEETLGMEPGSYEVQARVKFANGDSSPVRGVKVGTITILDAQSSEVI